MLYRDQETKTAVTSTRATEPERELPQSCAQLSSAIASLHDSITRLEGRFSSVCRDVSPSTDCENKKTEPAFCELGRSIEGSLDGVYAAMRRIENLMDRSQV